MYGFKEDQEPVDYMKSTPIEIEMDGDEEDQYLPSNHFTQLFKSKLINIDGKKSMAYK